MVIAYATLLLHEPQAPVIYDCDPGTSGEANPAIEYLGAYRKNYYFIKRVKSVTGELIASIVSWSQV